MVTNQWISDKPMWGLKAIYGLGLCRCITSYHWSNSPQVIALVPSIPPGSRHLPTPPTRQAEDWCSACRRTWPPSRDRTKQQESSWTSQILSSWSWKKRSNMFLPNQVGGSFVLDHPGPNDPVAIICGYLHHITSSFPDQLLNIVVSILVVDAL